MSKKNIFDVLEDYNVEDLRIIFQRRLYEYCGIIIEGGEIVAYDPYVAYSKNDMVYTYRLGIYAIYVSLLDDNVEPLTNEEAWLELESSVLTDSEFGALKSLMSDIIPHTIEWKRVDENDVDGINGLKYIIGLFFSCYLANQQKALGSSSTNGGIATSMSIDGMQATYVIPDYALNINNLFYSRNPFGLEILSLKNKLFIVPPFLTASIPSIKTYWRYGYYKYK